MAIAKVDDASNYFAVPVDSEQDPGTPFLIAGSGLAGSLAINELDIAYPYMAGPDLRNVFDLFPFLEFDPTTHSGIKRIGGNQVSEYVNRDGINRVLVYDFDMLSDINNAPWQNNPIPAHPLDADGPLLGDGDERFIEALGSPFDSGSGVFLEQDGMLKILAAFQGWADYDIVAHGNTADATSVGFSRYNSWIYRTILLDRAKDGARELSVPAEEVEAIIGGIDDAIADFDIADDLWVSTLDVQYGHQSEAMADLEMAISDLRDLHRVDSDSVQALIAEAALIIGDRSLSQAMDVGSGVDRLIDRADILMDRAERAFEEDQYKKSVELVAGGLSYLSQAYVGVNTLANAIPEPTTLHLVLLGMLPLLLHLHCRRT